MPRLAIVFFILLIFISTAVCSQTDDNTINNLNLPHKYISSIDKKVTEYSSRITSKTEKTLTKLSKWENKIHAILNETSPATAERLFGNNQLTFTALLQQVKEGKVISQNALAPYDQYRDNITTSLNYIQQQKQQLDSSFLNKAMVAGNKIKQLNKEEENNEAVQQFIKSRKKQLLEQALRQVGCSKYLSKINKEAFYYTETLKNYKEIFQDSKKAEQTGKELLSKIPAFQKFMQNNSMLAAMFGGGNSIPADGRNLAGLQTRTSVQSMIQDRISAGGPNGEETFRKSMEQAQAELGKLKDKITNQLPGAGNGGGDMPDFKPNIEKTKTFAQRIEYGTDMQFSRNNGFMPGTADIGLSVGYKLNDKSVVGIGGSYKLGLGSIDHIHFSQQGASVRTYTDWKLKKQFYLSGGFELNYLSAPISNYLLPVQSWQQSGLVGISKKLSIKTKLFKETKIQLLYDFLSQQHLPVSQPILFRVGYNF